MMAQGKQGLRETNLNADGVIVPLSLHCTICVFKKLSMYSSRNTVLSYKTNINLDLAHPPSEGKPPPCLFPGVKVFTLCMSVTPLGPRYCPGQSHIPLN